jgi:hypothetical protein
MKIYNMFTGNVLFPISGTLVGYIMYDLTHYYLHHGSPTLSNPVGKYFTRMKNYHVRHHFENQLKGKDRCYSSSAFDKSLRPCVIDSLFRVPWPLEIGVCALLAQHKIDFQHSAFLLPSTDLQKKYLLRISKILKNG